MDVVLGVDIGTTSAKAVAFGAGGERRGAAEHRLALRAPAPGHAVQDPVALMDAALAAVRDAAARAHAAGARVVAIGCGTAMHGLVGLGADGAPRTPLITWADTRAAAQARRLSDADPDLHRRTGTPVHPMAPLAKLAWLHAHEPATAAAVARWGGVKELLLDRLAGAWLLDHSCGTGTGLVALATLEYDDAALALAGVRRTRLAPLVPAGEVLALTPAAARATGLPAGTPVVAGAGDGPLANVGLGVASPGMAACSIGTSAALRVVTARPEVDGAGRLFCYALTPGRWILGGALSNAGAVLRWAGDALAPDLGANAEEALLALAAEVPAGSDGLLMLPYLHGERAPHWSVDARGAYVGLTSAHRRGHLVRAAVEGVCRQLALVLASVRAATGEVREVRAAGGLARSALWRQVLADSLDLPVGFVEDHQASAHGAARVAMEAIGMAAGGAGAEAVRIAEVVEPQPAAAAVYAALREAHEALYAALEPSMDALRDVAQAATGPPGGPSRRRRR